jgi:hypothetical protein
MTDIQVSKIDQKRPVFVRMQNGLKIKLKQQISNLSISQIDRKSFLKANWNLLKLQEIPRQKGIRWT